MMHELAAVQSIVDVHEPAPVQITAHGVPAGQTMGPVHVPAAVHPIVHVPPGSHVPRPASAQTEGHTPAASLARASPASASDGLASPASPASATDGLPSPASLSTLASSPGALSSPTVASASIVVPASRSTGRVPSVPSSARPQPKANHGMASSTGGERARRNKMAPVIRRTRPHAATMGRQARPGPHARTPGTRLVSRERSCSRTRGPLPASPSRTR